MMHGVHYMKNQRIAKKSLTLPLPFMKYNASLHLPNSVSLPKYVVLECPDCSGLQSPQSHRGGCGNVVYFMELSVSEQRKLF